jgi:hypothetical protein
MRVQFFIQGWLRKWILRHEVSIRSLSSELLVRKTLSGKELQDALGATWNGSKPDANELRSKLIAALRAQGLIKEPDVAVTHRPGHEPPHSV